MRLSIGARVLLSQHRALLQDLQLNADKLLPGELTESITVIQDLGIGFNENVGTEYYSLSQDKSMQLVGAFLINLHSSSSFLKSTPKSATLLQLL